MLINMEEMLKVADKNQFAVGAFNATESSLFRAVVEEAEAQNAPAIVQVAPGEFDFATRDFYQYVRARLSNSKVPFVLHLDHGKNFDSCKAAIEGGYTSVMIDGSELPMEENIAITKKVVAAAHACGVSVEAEIGHVGGRGDDAVKEDVYTTVEEAKTFYEQTGVDMLAVSIGTTHGVYLKKPELKFDRITELNEAIPIPLVMHGGSGLTKEDYIEVSKRGISKINFATYMFLAGGQAIEDKVNDAAGKKAEFNSLLKAGVDGQKQIVKEHIGYFGTEKWNKK